MILVLIIEKDERAAVDWFTAKATCLALGMRLPEPFEWGLACYNAGTWGLLNMITNSWEWTSNFNGLPSDTTFKTYIGGDGYCARMTSSSVGSSAQTTDKLYNYRCVK